MSWWDSSTDRTSFRYFIGELMNKRIALMEIKIEIRSKSQGNDDEIDEMTISFKGQKNNWNISSY